MNEIPLIVLGAGGHSTVLLDELQRIGRPVLGVLDPELAVGTKVLYSEVLGDDDYIYQFRPTEVQLVNGLGALPGTTERKALTEKMRKSGYKFLSVVSSAAVVSDSARLAEGVQIMAGAVIQANVDVGAHSVVNTSASIDHDCALSENVWISPGVTLCGRVTIEKDVFIGAGAAIIQDLTLGRGASIAAGSIVIQSVKANVDVRPTQAIIERQRTARNHG